METTGILRITQGLYRGYRENIRSYRDNGKEKGNYYNGEYTV